MAIHSSIPAWKIPWTGEPGGLQFMDLQRVRHDLATKQAHTLKMEYCAAFKKTEAYSKAHSQER